MPDIKRASRRGNGIIRHVSGDCASRANNGPGAYFYRGDKGGIRTDRGTIPNDCFKFAKSIIIAGDGTSPHIDIGADHTVTDIGQMVGLASRPNDRFFGLNKIANFDPIASLGTGRNRA